MDTVTAAFQRSLEEFRQEGREQGQVTLLRQQAARKFGPSTAEEVSRLLADVPDPVTIARISEAILNCDRAEEFLACVRGG